jgi:hypothetical protein
MTRMYRAGVMISVVLALSALPLRIQLTAPGEINVCASVVAGAPLVMKGVWDTKR